MTAVAFASEAELCEAFCAWVRAGGGHGADRRPWTIYPETGDFDLLMVDADGRQMGVEAKLRLNAKVILQAYPGRWWQGTGPDWRAILVPSAGGDLLSLARTLGLVVFTARRHWSGSSEIEFDPCLYTLDLAHAEWFDWNPSERVTLPDFVPTVAAGVPSPVKLTTWKVGALRVAAHLELVGWITAKEVRGYGVDPRRFCAGDGWLQSAGDARWTRGRMPDFAAQHPEAYAAARDALIPILRGHGVQLLDDAA